MQADRAVLGMSGGEAEALKVAGAARRGALIADVAAELGISYDAAARRLRSLKADGFVKPTRYRIRGHVKFHLTDCGRQALAHILRVERGQGG